MTSYANVLRAGTQRLQIFRLVAPASGANDVVVTMDADSPFSVGFASYTGVDPTVPIGTSANDTGGGTLATVDVTSAAGELVFDYTCVDDGTGTAPALSVGAGQTAQVNFSTSFGVPGFERAIASSTEAGAATVTMSWTDGAANSWVIIGGPLMPAAAPAPSSTRQRVVIFLP